MNSELPAPFPVHLDEHLLRSPLRAKQRHTQEIIYNVGVQRCGKQEKGRGGGTESMREGQVIALIRVVSVGLPRR